MSERLHPFSFLKQMIIPNYIITQMVLSLQWQRLHTLKILEIWIQCSQPSNIQIYLKYAQGLHSPIFRKNYLTTWLVCSTWHKLESPGKWTPQLRNCFLNWAMNIYVGHCLINDWHGWTQDIVGSGNPAGGPGFYEKTCWENQ